MIRFLSLLSGITFFSSAIVPIAYAEFIATQNCDGISTISEPLDSHTEARFKRYVRSNSFPKTFSKEEHLQRWCYLWEEGKERRENAREYRLQYRLRSLDERFYRIRQERLVVDFKTDKDFEDLTSNRQARVLQRVKSDNCDTAGESIRELEEYVICKRLIDAVDRKRIDIIEEKRIEIRYLRVSDQLRDAVQNRLTRRIDSYATRKYVESDLQSDEQKQKDLLNIFDLTGPGFRPLSNAIESRLRRYVENQNCSRMNNEKEIQRCTWLVQYDRYRKLGVMTRAEQRLRSFGIQENTVIRRGVSTQYRQTLQTLQIMIQQRRLKGGFRPTPRTIQDAQANYQTPIVIPSDHVPTLFGSGEDE